MQMTALYFYLISQLFIRLVKRFACSAGDSVALFPALLAHFSQPAVALLANLSSISVFRWLPHSSTLSLPLFALNLIVYTLGANYILHG